VTTALLAVAAYLGVLADVLLRARAIDDWGLVPAAIVGTLALLVTLFAGGRGLGVSLFLGGAIYVAFVVSDESRVEATAPLVAVLLLLCGELAAWSLDERWRMEADEVLVWRRGAAVGALALAGLAVSVLVVALSAVPASHGLAWTVAGAVAAVTAAGTGIWVARR
jgi:hypothetical protein